MMHGQTRVEFIFAVIIFSVIIFYVVNQINTISSSIITDYSINNMKAEANSVMETLTNDKGYPDDWTDFLNQGWAKRRKIEISQSPTELMDQQVRINITYDSDMKSDFSDIRFADSDQVTRIPYWIENKSDGNWALVWLKIHRIPEAEKKSVYMYYGYPSATSESNGNDVFMQFLDLSGSSLPPGWVKTDIGSGITGSATISNGILTVDNINGRDVHDTIYEDTQVYKNSTVSGDFVAVTRIVSDNASVSNSKAGIIIQNFMSVKNYNGMAYIAARKDLYAFSRLFSSSSIAPDRNNTTGSGPASFPTYLKLIRNNFNVSGYQSYDNINWVSIGSTRSPLAIEDYQYVSLFATPASSSQVIEANFSLFYVYRYASPEPTGTIKGEETKTNQSWFPIKTVGLADQPDVLSTDKITALNGNCDLLLNFGLSTYRLRIYNSTNLLLYCGTESLSPAKITVSKYVKVGNDLGNITLEMW
jgi:hypothetical protein